VLLRTMRRARPAKVERFMTRPRPRCQRVARRHAGDLR
jgi:hypothetical protein